MEFSRRRRLVWTLTALGIALFISTVTTVATDVAAIEAWATRNATGFPRAYDQVAALPVQYQKALLGVLPPDVVADLWRTHLERIIATDDLSVEQQAYLLKVRQQLTPDAFAEATATERFKTLCNEGRDVLGPERAAYFTRLDRGRFALAIGPLGAWPIMIDAGYRLQQSRPYRAVAEAIVQLFALGKALASARRTPGATATSALARSTASRAAGHRRAAAAFGFTHAPGPAHEAVWPGFSRRDIHAPG